MQVDIARYPHVAAGPQERWIGKHQFRREAVSQQFLGSVQIGQNRVQQGGALLDGGGDERPFRTVQNQGEGIQRPRPPGVLWIAVDIVGGTIFVDDAAAFLPAARESRLAHAFQRLDQRPPVCAHVPFGGHHLVVIAGIWLVAPVAIELLYRPGSVWIHERPTPIVSYPHSSISASLYGCATWKRATGVHHCYVHRSSSQPTKNAGRPVFSSIGGQSEGEEGAVGEPGSSPSADWCNEANSPGAGLAQRKSR